MPAPSPGLYLLHKPVGATSFGTLNSFVGPPGAPDRPKACHGGTLDPFAEGLLLALVGWCTHLFEPLHRLPKTYVAEVVWGVETDNGDPTGRPVARWHESAPHERAAEPRGPAPPDPAARLRAAELRGPAPPGPAALDPARLDAALAATLGWTEQVPPATSAKKLGGEPAYRKAHRGEPVVLPPSRVWLQTARWLEHLPGRSRVELVCAGGFYVRAWARDLGRALGVPAHLGALRREAIGPYRLAEVPGGGVAARRGLDAVSWLPRVVLDDADWGRLRAGGSLAARPEATASGATPKPGGAAPKPGGAARAPGPRVLPAPWSPPPGWPLAPAALVGLHQGQPVALLTEGPEGLRATSTWRRERSG